MGKCRTCGKEYHSCFSCGMEDWEHEFCREECMTQADQYAPTYEEIEEFLNELTEEQKFFLKMTYTWEWERLGYVLEDLDDSNKEFTEKVIAARKKKEKPKVHPIVKTVKVARVNKKRTDTDASE